MVRRSCNRCKAIKCGIDPNKGLCQIGCQLGYDIEFLEGEHFQYKQVRSGKGTFVNNAYPVTDCPKPTTYEHLLECYKSILLPQQKEKV